MTVIRPNSVSGINSITAQADEIKVFKSNGTQGGLIIGGANLNATTGISTILALNVTGNVSIAGTLTYQDVTNVDSLGIGTFRTGINVSGGQLDVGSNIKLGNAGVVTATSFSGSGANLTSLPTQVTIANNADNRVITGGSGTNLNGEANFTYNSDVATLTRSGNDNASGLVIANSNNSQGSAIAQVEIQGGDNASGRLKLECSGQNHTLIEDSTGNLSIEDNGIERLRIDSSGDIGLGESNPNRSGYSSPVVSVGYNNSNGYSVLELLGNKTDDNTIANIVAYNVGGSSRIGAIAFERSGANNSGAIRFETYASGSAAERLRITSSGAFYIKSPNSSTGDQPGEIQWWNENGAGVMAKIVAHREASLNAPSGLKFYTTQNVDTSANNSQGDITERLFINSEGKFYKGGHQFYPLVQIYEARLSGAVSNTGTGSYQDIKNVATYIPKKIGNRVHVQVMCQTWNASQTDGSADAYARLQHNNGGSYTTFTECDRVQGNFAMDERYRHSPFTMDGWFTATSTNSTIIKLQGNQAASLPVAFNWFHSYGGRITIMEYDIT